MYHRPVCVKCSIELRPKTNGVTVADYFMEDAKIYKLWEADLYQCPKCSLQIVVGFGQNAYAEHHTDNCDEKVWKTLQAGIPVIRNFEKAEEVK